jgi:SAM-dependent methyltransferase
MRRETVNRIRYVLEECIPPAIRDSRLMRGLFRLHWGPLVDDMESFREHITTITADDYRSVYERMPRLQQQTDNSRACLSAIARQILPGSICDVGCGTGYVLKFLQRRIDPRECQLHGVDFLIDPSLPAAHPLIHFFSAPIESLPFPDRHFDTVICTHVLEHILDIRAAISELRRVCRRRLIIVVPLEREYRFTFNPHVHFFPYPDSFLRYMIPVPSNYSLTVIGRDLMYVEEPADDVAQ